MTNRAPQRSLDIVQTSGRHIVPPAMPLKSGAFTQARNLVPLHPDNLVQPRGMGAASYREIRPTQPKRNHRHLSEPVTYLEVSATTV
jgi:hypothetical protein